MRLERVLREIAGFFVLISMVLVYFHSRWWLFFKAFMGFNLLQSDFFELVSHEINTSMVWYEEL